MAIFPETPEEQILANALADPLDELLFVEVDTLFEAKEVLDYVTGLPNPPETLELTFDGRTHALDLLLQAEEWCGQASDKPRCVVLLDVSNSTYYRSIPSLRTFWRQMNLQRERWGALPCTKLFFLGPRSYAITQQVALDISSWAAVRVHRVPDDPILGPGDQRSHALADLLVGGEGERAFTALLRAAANGADDEGLKLALQANTFVPEDVALLFASYSGGVFRDLQAEGEEHPEQDVAGFILEIVDRHFRHWIESMLTETEVCAILTSIASLQTVRQVVARARQEGDPELSKIREALADSKYPIPITEYEGIPGFTYSIPLFTDFAVLASILAGAWSVAQGLEGAQSRDVRIVHAQGCLQFAIDHMMDCHEESRLDADRRALYLGSVTGKEVWTAFPFALRTIRGLSWLELQDAVGVDLQALAGLEYLATLDLQGSDVSDLSPLSSLPALRTLDLSRTRIVDVSPLAYCASLEYLNLDQTPIKDLTPLHQLHSLKRVYLWRTPVSTEQVVALRAALPQCEILLTQQDGDE